MLLGLFPLEPRDRFALVYRHRCEPVSGALDPPHESPAYLASAGLDAKHVVKNHPYGVDWLHLPPDRPQHLRDSDGLLPVARPSLDVPGLRDEQVVILFRLSRRSAGDA